jgi:hypothetical protein
MRGGGIGVGLAVGWAVELARGWPEAMNWLATTTFVLLVGVRIRM